MNVEDAVDKMVDAIEIGIASSRAGAKQSFIREFQELECSEIRTHFYEGTNLDFLEEAKPEDVNGQFDVSVIFPGEKLKEHDSHYFRNQLAVIHRFRRALPFETRGMKFYPISGKHIPAEISASGLIRGLEPNFVGWNGRDWVLLNRPMFVNFPKFKLLYRELLGSMVARRYEWRAVIGAAGALSVSFPTTPTGARELFKLRTIPAGKMRRAALRHWVAKYTRKTRSEDAVTVRAHLRGQEEFDWFDWHVRIIPSKYDLELTQLKGADVAV